MSMNTGQTPGHSLPMLPQTQLVPSKVCLSCDVLCRFPEQDSFLRPYFAREEIVEAVNRGIDPGYFADHNGSQIVVVPHSNGDGCLCPAFDPETSHCRIYEVRPLDCQIYPFAIMWDADHKAVLLGWDQKCPWMMTEASAGMEVIRLIPEAEGYADQILERFEHDESVINFVSRNPQLVKSFQDDVVVVARLEVLTQYFSTQRSSP
ncbi:MAG: YkgJ family cysteine cluster protein [Nitrospirae bacterium]|nr:YkgJ family cysteine cluster protein [Nitrospirota bacterium]